MADVDEKKGPPIAIVPLGTHGFQAAPAQVDPASLARTLAERLQEMAARFDSGLAPAEDVRERRRLSAVLHALGDLDAEAGRADAPGKVVRRRIMVEALEQATSSNGPPSTTVALARGVLQAALGPLDVRDETLAAAIAAWSRRGKDKWPALHALANDLRCGADDLESFRSQMARL